MLNKSGMKFKNSLNHLTQNAQGLKALDLNLDALSLIPGPHVVEGEKQLPQICPLIFTCMLRHALAYKHMNK